MTKFGTTGEVLLPMLKKLVFVLVLLSCSDAFAYREVFNAHTGRLDKVGIENISRDLVATECANGEVMKYNGTNWACAADNTAAGASSEPRQDYMIDVSAGQGVSVDTTEVSKDVTWSDGTLGRLGFNFNLSSGSHAMKAESNQMVFTAPIRTSGDLTIAGDDLFMGTNTSGFILVGDGTNFNPVDMSGDVDIDSSGVTTVANNSHTHTASNISDQNAGTDITADLEEEAHASEHQDTGADEIAVTGGMMNADFGDYTCNGTATGCTLDSDVVSNDEIATQAVSTDQIQASNKPSDGYLLRYNATSLKGEWVPCSTVTGSSALCDGNDASGGGGSSTVEDYMMDVSAGGGVSVDTTEVSHDQTWSDGSLNRLRFNFNLANGSHGMNAELGKMVFTGHLQTSGDLTIAGDDLTMGTNTAGFLLVGDGTNYNPVDFSGDGDLSSAGVYSHGANSVSADEVAIQSIKQTDLEASDTAADAEIPTYNSTSGKFQWKTCAEITGSSGLCDGSDDGGVGSSGRDTNAQREFYWPMSALLPIQASADSIAPIVKDAGTNVDYLVRAFDSSATECVGGTFQMPANADTAKSITIRRRYYASTAHATSNRVIEAFKHSALSNSEGNDTAFTEVSFDSVTTDTTQDDITVASRDITMSSLGWVSSDLVTFEYCRKGNALGDDLGTDLYGIDFAIEIPRSASNSQ